MSRTDFSLLRSRELHRSMRQHCKPAPAEAAWEPYAGFLLAVAIAAGVVASFLQCMGAL